MKLIRINGGHFVKVDDADYDRVADRNWYVCSAGYARHTIYPRVKGSPTSLLMHRVIMNTPEGMLTDHINHDTLDNRRSNLRVCDQSQNNANSRMLRSNTKGQFKGVSKHPASERWYAQISVNKNHIYLGCFKSEIDAARVYNEAAKKHFGEFAYLNPVEYVGGEK